MNNFSLGTLDYVAFGLFFVVLSAIGFWAGRGERRSSNDYFLAGNSLPWYVVGGSLVASVMSTEHFVGMVAWVVIFGVSIGLWTWALVTDITLLIFLWVPFLLASRVFTIPQFLFDALLSFFQPLFVFLSLRTTFRGVNNFSDFDGCLQSLHRQYT